MTALRWSHLHPITPDAVNHSYGQRVRFKTAVTREGLAVLLLVGHRTLKRWVGREGPVPGTAAWHARSVAVVRGLRRLCALPRLSRRWDPATRQYVEPDVPHVNAIAWWKERGGTTHSRGWGLHLDAEPGTASAVLGAHLVQLGTYSLANAAELLGVDVETIEHAELEP